MAFLIGYVLTSGKRGEKRRFLRVEALRGVLETAEYGSPGSLLYSTIDSFYFIK